MKFASWNVNGLRAAVRKGFFEVFNKMDADIFAVQETKMKEEQKDFTFDGYHEFWNSAERPGYSGTLTLAKEKPLSVTRGLLEETDVEGRVITLEYDDFYFVNTYSPNSGEGLKRLPFRMDFETRFHEHLQSLDAKKPVILTGDLNVAHEEIDLKNPKNNQKNAGFTDEERKRFTKLLGKGFSDTFRTLHPSKVQYTWWTYRFNARKRNAGWRIDYFLVSERLMERVKESRIHDDIHGSDHCPVFMEIDL